MPQYLSASSILTWEQCPQRYKYSRIDQLPEPENQSQLMGTFVHEVLEQVYMLPAEQRTVGNAQQVSRVAWARGWVERLAGMNMTEAEMREFRWKSWWCIENLWTVEDPTKVLPIGLESEYNTEVIPGINIRGFVDRISEVGDGARITDYKTGKFPKPAYMDQKWFQLLLYKLVVERTIGKPVNEVQLIYLKDGKALGRTTTPEDDVATLARVAKTHSEIQVALRTGEFETKVSRLCDWCHYKKICPAWGARRK
jgi:putative RecB family exonuclease